MPKRRVAPFRPTVGAISEMLRENRDQYWVDSLGRAYGFMVGDYSLALWKGGTMEDDEAHMWVLLPRVARDEKDRPTFPAPRTRVALRPFQRPDAPPKAGIVIRRYVHRPRRQRAAGLIAAVTDFSGIDPPVGRALASRHERERRQAEDEDEEEARRET